MKLITKHHTDNTPCRTISPRDIFFCVLGIQMLVFSSCNNGHRPPPPTEIVSTPQQMKEKVPDIIKRFIDHIGDNNGRLDDSTSFLQPALLQWLYEKNNYAPSWSKEEQWTPLADSLISFIKNARLYGLFPGDYHFKNISFIQQRISGDSLNRKDAVLWSKADVLLTDALMHVINDIKLGRLQKDSITLRTDSALANEFYEEQLAKIFGSNSLANVIDSLEPQIRGYHELKAGIKSFLDSAEFKDYTYVPFPVYDSAKFRQALQRRLFEQNLLLSADSLVDSMALAQAIKKYQQQKKLKADGKVGAETVGSLNATDKNKFALVAINLDKFKMLPAKMPGKYVWVNLAGYYLQLWDSDTVSLYSKVVVGKPLTRTPELNSSISEMITYPQWSIPQSIIMKEILPELKKDPGYLEKKGYSLLDAKNEEVDPYFVDWSKYKKEIPYRVIQGSGDDNALGIMKFNFPNKYAVYLHDTNQRYLFARSARSFSHGCVRVQAWQDLTNYILRNDSMYVVTEGKGAYTKADSVMYWLGNKEKHSIPVRKKIPLFIRYFTCEGQNGKIVFYDDIYNEDRRLQEKYFNGK